MARIYSWQAEVQSRCRRRRVERERVGAGPRADSRRDGLDGTAASPRPEAFRLLLVVLGCLLGAWVLAELAVRNGVAAALTSGCLLMGMLALMVADQLQEPRER